MDVKNIVRLDIIEGKPRTFVYGENLENGFFLEIDGKAENAVLGVQADYEAYKVKLATADTKRANLLFHCSVANQYDERKLPCEFELEAGRPGRGYQPVLGDIVTIPAKLVADEVVEKDELKLGADGKLAKATTGDTVLAVVEAKEDIVIPMYKYEFGKQGVDDTVQKSLVIRFV